jgi:V/A-type H+-transporting ATPase subunit D
MGVIYPGAVHCSPSPDPIVHSTAALRPTIDAYRLALQAAADHASTTAALGRLNAELADTRRRRRAIEQRLLPRLEATIHDLDLYLDEQDRDEALRVQLASSQKRTPRPC